jgi:methylmalonyl-CoA mutase cobalamin-binding subunit
VPAAEVAAAAAQLQPRAVALSIVYPTDDPHVLEELRRLREFLPDEVAILIGGAAAPSYLPALEPLDLVHLPDLPALRAWLRDVRKP